MAADSDRRYPHAIRHTIDATVTPIVIFLTAIVTPAGLAMTGETQAMEIVLLGEQEPLHTLPSTQGHFHGDDNIMKMVFCVS